MALPLERKNRNTSNKRLIKNCSQFAEGWAGIGIMIGIWAVTFGIIASGIISM
jgi:hypothetical protein